MFKLSMNVSSYKNTKCTLICEQIKTERNNCKFKFNIFLLFKNYHFLKSYYCWSTRGDNYKICSYLSPYCVWGTNKNECEFGTSSPNLFHFTKWITQGLSPLCPVEWTWSTLPNKRKVKLKCIYINRLFSPNTFHLKQLNMLHAHFFPFHILWSHFIYFSDIVTDLFSLCFW